MSTTWSQPIPFYEGESEAHLREAFVEYRARQLAKSDFEIASFVFQGLPNSAQRAGMAAIVWGQDLSILDEVQERRRKGFDESIVSKDVLTAEVLAIARTDQVGVKERLEAYKLAATMNGFIEKGNGGVNVQVNRVMIVKDHGSDDNWEESVKVQQQRLMAGHVN